MIRRQGTTMGREVVTSMVREVMAQERTSMAREFTITDTLILISMVREVMITDRVRTTIITSTRRRVASASPGHPGMAMDPIMGRRRGHLAPSDVE